MVTGRISLTAPEYSPISSSVSDGTPQQLVLPLPARDRVGDQDQRGGLRRAPWRPRRRSSCRRRTGARRRRTRRARTTRRRRAGSRAGATGLLERDRVRLAVDVPGQVLGRPAELEQHLLEVAALGGVHDDGVVVDPRRRPCRRTFFDAQHLLEHRAVGGDQDQPVHRVLLQAQPPVPRHRLRDVDEQRVRDRVAGVAQQRVDDLLGVVAGGAGVPQPQRGQPVGVDVLRRALQLGERRDRLAAVGCAFVVDLEQQGLVGLDDERAVMHRSSLRAAPHDGRARRGRRRSPPAGRALPLRRRRRCQAAW